MTTQPIQWGPCAKVTVKCTISDGNGAVIVTGTNRCANPQFTCPRAPGEDYTKCTTVCQQDGHAEVVAARMVAEFKDADDLRSIHATAHLSGHTYMCMNCQHALSDAGVVFFHLFTPRIPA